jgi:uncharacterized heparinase superfamily protein
MQQRDALQASGGLGWYLGRLRVMSPGEIVHRLAEQLAIRRLRAAQGRFVPADAAALAFCRATRAQLPRPPLDETAILAQQADLLAGCWPALGFAWQWRDDPAAWRRAPDTGREWPRAFFAAIAHRPGNAVGDVRVAWEPARLQQLVSLAVVARHGEPAAAAQALRLIEAQLASFVAANPPWSGIHYISAMECALRLIAVAHALDMVRDCLAPDSAAWAAVASLASSHAPFIAARLSLHSSAGNHTIAECAGLVYAGCLFPELPGAERWRRRGLAILTTEIARQVHADGGGIEQAFWYLLFITDLAGLVVALLDHRGETVPEALREAVTRAQGFLRALAARPEELPDVGDRDDGFALSPALRLGLAGATTRGRGHTFAQSGYSTARMEAAPHYEVLFDHGPLGMAPLFGHGHADALSVCLRAAGRELLLDPGTFAYGGDLDWRRYFRSTAAHNTVCVDGQDQAVQLSAFSWSQPYRCELLRSERGAGVFRALARHDGYTRLPGQVLHWRGVVLRTGYGLLVWDLLDGDGAHDVELRWHVRDIAAAPAGVLLLGADTVLAIDGGTTSVQRAATDPPAGWRSPRYGAREAAATVRTVASGALPVEFTTRIHPRDVTWPAPLLKEDLETLRAWVRAR